jgi:hypothetical protein|tara:strand:- start:465 stop:1334 length:870 start_codon:yes stop_codon:yes gene_type:complete
MADDQQDNVYPEGYDPAVNLADVEFTAARVNDTYFNPLSYLGFRALAKRHGGEYAKADLSKFYSPVMASRVPKGTKNQTPQIMGDHPKIRIYGTDWRGLYTSKEGKVRVNTTDFLDLYHSGAAGKLTREEASNLQRTDINRAESHEFGHAGFKHLKKQGKLPQGNFAEEDVMKVLDSVQFYKRLRTPRPVQPAREKLNFKESSLVSWPIARIAMGVVSHQENIPYPYSKNLSHKEKRWVNYIVDLIAAAENELAQQSRFPPESTKERNPEKRAHGGFVDKPLYDRDPYD